MVRRWEDLRRCILARLTADDDPCLWKAAVNEVYREAEYLCRSARCKSPIFTQLGVCSHWLSPHNNGSWLADARYAWPSGYGGGRHSIRGLPEFDWSLLWQWDKTSHRWTAHERKRGKRPLTFRVAIPTRTARHSRAVIHALWIPGPPTVPETKLLQAYGFVKDGSQWTCTCTFGRDHPYGLEQDAT